MPAPFHSRRQADGAAGDKVAGNEARGRRKRGVVDTPGPKESER